MDKGKQDTAAVVVVVNQEQQKMRSSEKMNFCLKLNKRVEFIGEVGGSLKLVSTFCLFFFFLLFH